MHERFDLTRRLSILSHGLRFASPFDRSIARSSEQFAWSQVHRFDSRAMLQFTGSDIHDR